MWNYNTSSSNSVLINKVIQIRDFIISKEPCKYTSMKLGKTMREKKVKSAKASKKKRKKRDKDLQILQERHGSAMEN